MDVSDPVKNDDPIIEGASPEEIELERKRLENFKKAQEEFE